MSIIDKVVAAVTPLESEDTRQAARAKARVSAGIGDWLEMVLDHHLQVEAAFAAVTSSADPASRISSLKKLSVLLTGHSIAEEAALYPALAKVDEKSHAVKAYTEQSAAKLQMALLLDLPPMSQEFVDKLEHIQGAVAHHIYEEESNWFMDLKRQTPAADQVKLTQRYQEHFARYMGDESDI